MILYLTKLEIDVFNDPEPYYLHISYLTDSNNANLLIDHMVSSSTNKEIIYT